MPPTSVSVKRLLNSKYSTKLSKTVFLIYRPVGTIWRLRVPRATIYGSVCGKKILADDLPKYFISHKF